ncbi:RTA1-domain-containing protein [Gonapodya prolifera JEL478]|uniref:RTA1-domain-containing protein n=1 Tax=Gonapodya prolifera (strain JEL478) TaxID=1344416 RepID=A0A138ZYH5_GONPJ|nr:RTA1-domain-containing protein [Gonapodya prolifera JEL478]|eukprot:KXS09549.1 RTA1-domain-containing protein [Gonapodya prolifera JEL478]
MSVDWSATFFHYEPTTSLAYTALAGFTVLAIVHVGYFFTHRSFFMWPFVAGSIMECAGFAARILSINNPFQSKYYAAQHGLIVLAPVFFSAGYYVILARTISLLGDAYSPIRSRLVVRIFVASDLISFLIQISGSGLLLGSTDINKIDIGEKVLVGGLVVQAISTALFLLLVVVVTLRANHLQGSWKRISAVLLLGAVLILIRSIFRVAEFSGGFTGPLALNEPLLYILDILLMFIATGMLCLVHPAVHLRVTEREPLHPSLDPSEMEMNRSK